MNKNLVNVPTSELEDAYLKFSSEITVSNFKTVEGKLLEQNAHAIYQELDENRKEHMRAVILLLRHDLSEACTEDIIDLWEILTKQQIGGKGIFAESYTDAGDPIDDIAGILDCFKWILETELGSRNFDVRGILYNKYYTVAGA